MTETNSSFIPPIPATDPLQVPWGVFEALDLVTFFIHILFMNVALGGLLIILFSGIRGPSRSREILARKLPVAVPFAVTFGVAPLLFVQVNYGHLLYSSSILMGSYWILAIPLLIIAYYGAYIQSLRYKSSGAASRGVVLFSALILLYVAFMFSNNMTLMVRPEQWSAYFDRPSGTVLNLSDPQILPRFLHMTTGAVAVAGLFMAVTRFFRKKGDPHTENDPYENTGLRIFACATLVQVPVGLWFLLSHPSGVTRLFWGGNILYTVSLWTGAVMGAVAIITAFAGRLRITALLVLVTLILMTLSRAFLRAAYVGRFFSMENLQVEPRYSPMIVFFIVFVLGVLVVAYLIRTALRAERRGISA